MRHRHSTLLGGVLWTRSRRDVLSQKLAEVDVQLRDAKADRKETERDRRMTDAVQKLKRMHPGMPQAPSLSQLDVSLLIDGCWDLFNQSFKGRITIIPVANAWRPSQGIVYIFNMHSYILKEAVPV